MSARVARPSGGRAVAAAALLAALAACATARPEQRLAVTTDDGRLVPPDSVTVSYEVGGVRVIQRPNAATDVVAAHLYLLGGTRQLTAATQGIEALLLGAAEYGSARYPGGTSRAAWARTGSESIVSAEADWTLYGFRGVRQEFDATWNVFADRLLHPALAPHDVAVVRARLVQRLVQRQHDPDGLLRLIADSVAFAGHPYGLRPAGTEASLASLDSATLARYAAEQLVTSRMLLVVVGNVRRDEVERAVTRTLATLPRGSYQWTLPPTMTAAAPRVSFAERPVSTNYILGVFQGPPASAPDHAAFRVATALLGARMHEVVREQLGLSYAAYAPFTERGVASGGVYVSTNAPNLVLPMIRREITALRDLPAGSVNMRAFTDQFVLEYLAEHTSSTAQADLLARAQLYRGDFRKASQTMEELRGVSSSSVHAAARRYFTHVQFVYLGDSTRVAPAAFSGF